MIALRKYLWDLVVNGLLASPLVPIGARVRLLRLIGVRVGKGVRIRHRVTLTSKQLIIGDGCYINVGAVIQNSTHVTLERDVAIAPNAVITTMTHDSSSPDRRQGTPVHAEVVIGRGTWIGVGAIVLPGRRVGPGALIAAGAVVTKDCAPHWLHGGVPASPMRELPGMPEKAWSLIGSEPVPASSLN